MQKPQIRLALVAHDNLKDEIVDWAVQNTSVLSKLKLFGTGTTSQRIAEKTGLEITSLKSGPLGGDQQIGALIAEGKLDILIFFSDPLAAMPHDVDVKALLRMSNLANIVTAGNRATADVVVEAIRANSVPRSQFPKI